MWLYFRDDHKAKFPLSGLLVLEDEDIMTRRRVYGRSFHEPTVVSPGADTARG